MTYVADIATLRAPVADNWDFSQTPVLWESEGDNPPRFLTGDPGAPGEYMLWRSEFAPGEYLASGGGNQRMKHADVDCRICVEKTARGGADSIIAARLDLLDTYYTNASNGSVNFRTPEAAISPQYEYQDAWIARDWTLPVLVFAPGPEDQLLAGESANQLTVTQASHGFSAGDWIYFDGSNWAKAQANAQSTGADGIVSSVVSASKFIVTLGDVVKITSHGLTLGALYLSADTAGAATSTEPSGGYRQYLGKAIDANYLFLKIGDIVLF